MTTNTTPLDQFIEVIPGLIDKEGCADLIGMTEDSPHWQLSQIEGQVQNSDIRNCSILPISHMAREGIELYQTIDQYLFPIASDALKAYSNEHSAVSISKDTGYALLRYEAGQFYTQHTDSFTEEQRTLTCSLMLNDDYEGGEFCFFDQALSYRPSAGDALMFPSNFMYPHEIRPITSGIRYSLITWYV